MADCEILQDCIFFNGTMSNMPGTSSLFRDNYCQGSSSACARFVVWKALGRARVPRDLFPNQADRARDIVGASAGDDAAPESVTDRR